MKLCKDCKHYSKEYQFDRCGKWIDPVDGTPGAFADIEREGTGLRTGCGVEGKQWEPIPSKPPSWFARVFLGK